MTCAQESNRIASVRFAEGHGLTDTEPVLDGHSAQGELAEEQNREASNVRRN